MESVQICGCWNIIYNPAGEGLALCVDRGISCEGHTQIVSYHTTNTPSLATVAAVVEERREKLEKQITAFIALMHSLKDWNLKEHIGLLFIHHLAQTIAEEAERREYPV